MALGSSSSAPAATGGRRPLDRIVLLAGVLGALAAALGVLTMTAWYLRWWAVLRPGPGAWPIMFNSGLGLALTGTAVVGMALGILRHVAVVTAGFDLTVGSLTLVEYLTDRGLGIDELFAPARLSVPGTVPGRIAPTVAVCWVALGTGILASAPWRQRRRPLWLALSGAPVLGVAVVTLFGYAAGLPGAYGWGRLTGMPLITACGMALLGSASIVLGWIEVRGTAEPAQWWTLPAGLFTLTLSILLWGALVSAGQLSAPDDHQGHDELMRATTFIVALLVVVLAAAVRLSRRAAVAARALRESEARYRGMMISLGEGIVVQDAESRVVECNPAAERILGLCQDELTGPPGPPALDPRRQTLREDGTPFPGRAYPSVVTLRTGRPCRGVVMRVRADRRHDRWLLVNSEPLIHPGQVEPYGVIASYADITEVHRAQEEFRALTDNFPDFVARYDRDGRRLYVNPALANAYGLPRQQLVGRVVGAPDDGSDRLTLLPESVTRLLSGIREVFDRRAGTEFEITYRAADGLRVAHYRLVPECDRDGEVADVLAVGRDLTDLKRVERELAERESRYRDVFDNALESMFLVQVGPDGQPFRILEANPALERAYGIPREAMIGKATAEVVPPETAAAIDAAYRRCLEAGVPIEEEAALDLPTGRRWFQATLIPARDATGQVYRIVGISRDITEHRDAERQLQLLGHALDEVGEAVLLMAEDDPHFIFANRGAVESLGYSREELTGGMGIFDIDPDWSPQVWSGFWPQLQALRTKRFESRHRTRDGRVYPAEISANLFEFGDELFNLSISRDISERRDSELALADSEERFRLAFDDSLVGMALLAVDSTPRFQYLRVNHAMCEFLDRTENDLLTQRQADVLAPDDIDITESALQSLLDGNQTSHRAERRFRHTNGETVWGLLGATLVRDAAGEPLYVLSQVEDITARKRAEDQLVHRTLHDDLTGLPNRALLMEHLAGALTRARRSTTLVGVLFIDLDDFKAVNDSFGHSAGDEFLTRVATRISASVRASDTAARVGGDEFVIICENLTEPADAAVVADQVQRALAAEIPLRGHPVTAPASMGIALSSEKSTPENLLRDADAAMYVAKNRGGRRWEPADASLHAAALRVLSLESELRHALEHHHFTVHYQPLVDIRTGHIVSLEALVRWHHPQRGLISPTDFIDVAEQRGLINELGAWVLHTACAQAATWHQRYGPTAPSLAVNVSTRQLGNHGMTNHVNHALSNSPLPPDHLYLELTESQLLAAGTSSTTDLRTLHERGIRIAVDDFGTGYAGFDYLRRLPIDELKIDKTFIDGLTHDRTQTAITASIITLGLNLGLTVVAEGIETPDQSQALHDLGCTWGQGWLWHRALPPDDIDALLDAQRAGGAPSARE